MDAVEAAEHLLRVVTLYKKERRKQSRYVRETRVKVVIGCFIAICKDLFPKEVWKEAQPAPLSPARGQLQ